MAVDPTNYSQFPSEVLYRSALKWARDDGYTWCDYGETTPAFDDGSFAFKSSFGGVVQPIVRWERVSSLVGRVLYLLGSERIVRRLFARASGTAADR